LESPLKVKLLEVKEEDVERLAEISKGAFDSDSDFGAPVEARPYGYDSTVFYSRMLKFFDCYVILLGEEIVGGVMVKVIGKHGIVERLFVDPKHHRKGIGSIGMEQTMNKYPEVVLWTLGSPEWNVRTNNFYEGLGFKHIGWDYSEFAFRRRWYEKRLGESEVIIPIATLRDGANNVLVEGKVTEKSFLRTVRSKKTGGDLNVANAALEDNSGRIVMVLWDKQTELVKVGGRVRVENGYTNSYSGITQLNIGYGHLIILI
jgi:GNAT superfamily N-acetyltransferase